MTHRTRVVAALALACVTGISSALAAAPTAKRALEVTSTLDGKRVLPLRIHWIAGPHIASSRVKEVDFLIDGRLGWVEHRAPYVYGDDGNWLVTSFLKPGMHTFTVRAITFNDRKTSDTVKARVVAAPAPPAQLAGIWRRRVTPADVQKASSSQPPPPGVWNIHISSTGWRMTDPNNGGGIFDVAYLSATTLRMRPTIETPPFPNPSNGGFCEDTDPLFNWTAKAASDDKTLRLDPKGKDPCGDRAAILQGTWRRIQ